MLRKEVFRYFPERPAPLEAQWGEKTVARGRMIKKVTFTSFDGQGSDRRYSETRVPRTWEPVCSGQRVLT